MPTFNNPNNPLYVSIVNGSMPDTVGITDGTNLANVLSSTGTYAGQDALITAGTYLPVSFSTTTAQAVASTDVGNYRWVSVQINSQGTSSTVAFQSSNDNSTWNTINLVQSNSSTGIPVVNTISTGLYHGPLVGRYFRLNVTGIASGTTNGVILFTTNPMEVTTAQVVNTVQQTRFYATPTSVSVTSTASSISAASNQVWITLYNSGSNTAYVNANGTATTSSFPVPVGAVYTFYTGQNLSVICASAQTTTLNVQKVQ